MSKNNLQKFLLYLLLITVIFFIDRISKLYIVDLFNDKDLLNIYVTPFLNIHLVWNQGIAFGLLSFDNSFFYELITILIVGIIIIITLMIIKAKNLSVYFLIAILGGSLGNLFDRLYYSAVPDFIDFHIMEFHWFVFNVADIFITIGIICLIIAEMFPNKFKK
ncbi:signal peptidase II [Candidatus Pelagibacter sp.]|nr:signal peptidase II [Candidatus Pelagibacter sp.]